MILAPSGRLAFGFTQSRDVGTSRLEIQNLVALTEVGSSSQKAHEIRNGGHSSLLPLSQRSVPA